MQGLLQQVISGIATGGIFASLALALVLIYNAMGLVNFAQGEMAMLATFVAFTLIDHGMSYWIAFPSALLIAFAGGILIQRIVIRPVERAPILTMVIVTLGLATLVNGLAGFIFGYVPRSFPSPFSVQTVDILGAFVSYRDLGVIAVSAVVLLAALVFLLLRFAGLRAWHAAVCILLGCWQIRRLWARQKANDIVAARRFAPEVELDSLPRDTAAAHFRRVHLRGIYDNAQEIIYTLRGRNGSPGINILTPLLRAHRINRWASSVLGCRAILSSR